MVKRFRIAVVVLVSAVLVGTGAWIWLRHRTHPRVDSGACHGCNLLLITIDTLRRDRVGAFGGPANLTPTLDRLAAEGLRLDRAYASAPLTLPSHASILTAVSPPVHGVRTNGLFRLGPELPTLATILHGAGYRTGAFVGAFVLDARFGLTRGFDVYDDRYGEKHADDPTEGAERKAEQVVEPAAAWILQREPAAATEHPVLSTPQPALSTQHPAPGTQHSAPSTQHRGGGVNPWFAWVHLYDPHEPYNAPAPYANGREPYDGEVAYADAMVGRLLDELRAAGQLDRTLVIVAADHGESLGEHGERTHGVFVYDVTMRVPWVIWAGSRIGRGAFNGLARLIDLAPTALDLLGIAPPSSFEGHTLLPAIRGAEPGPSTAYLEAMDANLTRNWAPLTAIVNGDEKLIDLPIAELYDLSSDPSETTNRLSRESDRARVLTSLLRGELARFAARASAGAQQTTLSAESRQRLQALGYVATSADPSQRVYTDVDDPKNLIAVSEDLNRALREFKSGAHGSAMTDVARIIREHPTFSTAYGIFASMQRQTGDLPGAIRTLEALVRRGTADASVMTVLAGDLQESGALPQAAGVLEAVIASHPDYADAYNSLGVVYSRLGRHAEARAAFRKVLTLDPSSATAYENLGVDEFQAGELPAAIDDLRRAIDLDPKLAVAHNALASAYLRSGRAADAFREWDAALRANPRLYDTLYNLGISLWDAGRHDDARPYLERFVAEAPPRYAADVERVRRLIR